MTSTLDAYMNRMVNVVTGDGRVIVGLLKVKYLERNVASALGDKGSSLCQEISKMQHILIIIKHEILNPNFEEIVQKD